MEKQPGLVNLTLSKTLETILNQAIRLDDAHGAAFNALEDKVIGVEFVGLADTHYFLFTDQQVSIQQNINGEADALLKTNLIDLMTLPLTHELPSAQFVTNEALAQAFIKALATLEIDWEEHLSHYTGDLLAFKIGHGVRSIIASKQATNAAIGNIIKEYLQFEIETVPTKNQVKHFNQTVNKTAVEVDELALRIETLLTQQFAKQS